MREEGDDDDHGEPNSFHNNDDDALGKSIGNNSTRSLDPPLVPATRLMDSNGNPDGGTLVIQAIVLEDDDDDDNEEHHNEDQHHVVMATANVAQETVHHNHFTDVSTGTAATTTTTTAHATLIQGSQDNSNSSSRRQRQRQLFENYYEDDALSESLTIHERNSESIAASANTTNALMIQMTQQQHDLGRLESVMIDEIPTRRDGGSVGMEQSLMEQDETKKTLSGVCQRYWKVLILVLACVGLGAAAGAVFATRSTRNGSTLVVTPPKQPSPPSSTPLGPTVSPSPTISFQPTSSPTCTAKWTATQNLVLNNDVNDGIQYTNLLVSPDGSTVILRLEKNQRDYASFFHTIHQTDGRFESRMTRTLNFDIADATLNRNGSHLILGLYNQVDDYMSEEIGGALIVYLRLERTWIPSHYMFTGGGSRGVVFSVATNHAGSVYGIAAGSYANTIPAYVQVYTAATANVENDAVPSLEPVGKRMERNGINSNTLIGLSANGERLILFTDNPSITIYDFDGIDWQPMNDIAGPKEFVNSLEVAQDGKTFALWSTVTRESYVYHWDGMKWIKSIIQGPGNNSKPLQHCSLSADGTTFVVAREDSGRSQAFIYERRSSNDWRRVIDTLQLPSGGSLLGLSVDISGDQVIAATTQLLLVYERVCISSYQNSTAPTPVPTTLSSVAPTCVDNYSEFFLVFESLDSVAPASVVFSPTSEPRIASDNESLPCSTSNTINGGTINATEAMLPCAPTFSTTGNATNSSAPIDSPLGGGDILEDGNLNNALQLQYQNHFVSSDGSIMVTFERVFPYQIQTFNLGNSSAVVDTMFFDQPVKSMALSGDGQRLVVGTYVSDMTEAIIPIETSGRFYVYIRKNESYWEEEVSLAAGAGIGGGVYAVAITDEGNTMAFLAYGGTYNNSIGFISVRAVRTGGVFLQLGNTVEGGGGGKSNWINDMTQIAIFESSSSSSSSRLITSSSDGLIRTFDLIDNSAWQQVGQVLPNFGGVMFTAPLNPDFLATVQGSFAVDLSEFVFSYWQPLGFQLFADVSNPEHLLLSFAASTDASIVVLTWTDQQQSSQGDYPYLIAHWYQRSNGGDEYQFIQEMQLNIMGSVEVTQISSNGELLVVTEFQTAVYRRIPCVD